MNVTSRMKRILAILIAGVLLLAGTASAQHGEPEDAPGAMRVEIWFAVLSWPGLNELQPVAGGAFEQIGIGIGGAAHWPIRKLGNGALMLGIEGAITANDSNVPVYLDELMARNGYLAVSAKWMMGKARAVSLDAGLAYHLLDITQLETDYSTSVEFESWEEAALGPFLGVTWDPGGRRQGRNSGMTLGLRAHFLDFGTVRDEDVLASVVLGRNAGELDGPIFMLQIGYRWR